MATLSSPSARLCNVGRLTRASSARFFRAPLLFAGVLGGGDKRNAQSENESGDSEPYRSPKTKLRGARRRFATASPNEEEPLEAALNPPFLWCPNDAKCRPRQREPTGDEECSAGYHTSNLPEGYRPTRAPADDSDSPVSGNGHTEWHPISSASHRCRNSKSCSTLSHGPAISRCKRGGTLSRSIEPQALGIQRPTSTPFCESGTRCTQTGGLTSLKRYPARTEPEAGTLPLRSP